MKKLILSALCMVLCTTIFAQTETDFTVELTKDGEGVVITGYTGTATAVKIPAAIQGMPVREIGGSGKGGGYTGAFSYKSITSIVIPEGVTIIREESFEHNNKLTQVTLPSTLQIIERRAFYFNTMLKSIIIPEGVTEIGAGAFDNCSSLASITLPKSLVKLGHSAFVSSAITSITLPPNLTRIAGTTFWNCKKLVSIIIPEGVTEIGDSYEGGGGRGAFDDCTALTSVTLPSTIKKIGNSAFSGCSALTTVTIPDTVENIEMSDILYNAPFEGCKNINLVSQARLKKVGYKGSF
jgi:hypothetical protein